MLAMRILLVEDAPDVREALTTLLRAEGAEVVATGSGRQAVELAAGRPFDVLLTDLGLPDLPGDAVIRSALHTATGALRVVVVTGYGEPYLARAREAGAHVVLGKPVDWPRLLESLTRIPRAPVAA